MLPTDERWARRPLFAFTLATDLGFVAYWLVTAAHVLPEAWLFKDYRDPVLNDWNWSFMAIDLLVSATGLSAAWLWKRRDARAQPLALMSLTLTSTSGLMALAFWTLRGDFEPGWWAPNLFLLVWPLCFVPRFLVTTGPRAPTAAPRS